MALSYPMSRCILVTVFDDAVKLEAQIDWKMECIGWFPDEISAITAVLERTLIRSAILPELRRLLPECTIKCEYKSEKCGKEASPFTRGTMVKRGANGRRIVRRPGALAFPWMR